MLPNPSLELSGYAGPEISQVVASLLALLATHGFKRAVTGGANKTVRIRRDGSEVGYVNSTVLQRDGVLGYHFAPHGRAADACPLELSDRLAEYIAQRYGVPVEALDVQKTTKHTYLIFREPTTALRVLLRDANADLSDDVQIVLTGGKYVEGRIVDVVLRRRERSATARAACLKAHGFSCFTCGVNLKSQYSGLLVEVIHVHHEEPLGNAEGEREFDPVAKMKPLCPNCHAVAHAREPAYSVSEVRAMLSGNVPNGGRDGR